MQPMIFQVTKSHNLVFSLIQVHDLILRNPLAALNGLHRATFRWGAKTTDHMTHSCLAASSKQVRINLFIILSAIGLNWMHTRSCNLLDNITYLVYCWTMCQWLKSDSWEQQLIGGFHWEVKEHYEPSPLVLIYKKIATWLLCGIPLFAAVFRVCCLLWMHGSKVY